MDEIDKMLAEDCSRMAHIHAPFNPISGKGAPGRRVEASIHWPGEDTPRRLWLPRAMLTHPVAARAVADGALSQSDTEEFERVRILHDFPYWAGKYAHIKRKGGGEDCLLRLTYPQRIFVDRLERQRLAGKPIRLVLLKARQWGGSTVSQLYIAWLQLVHRAGLNSLIIAHQGTATDEIKDMFVRMLDAYPLWLLHEPGHECSPKEKKLEGAGRDTWRVPQRNCKIKIGTAERTDACRGGDYNLVHLSEVGMWKATKGKKPEDIVRAACGGILYKPYTMVVYESTANGVGNFFHREYIDARDNPAAQFKSLFIAWHQIEHNERPFADEDERRRFAISLYDQRENPEAPSRRQEPGQYLWWLWQKGATLAGINWYITERAKHSSHGLMAAECPSDDTEAFVNSGKPVFDMYKVEALRPGCMPPSAIGDVCATAGMPVRSPDGRFNPATLRDVHFTPDSHGTLQVWSMPQPDAFHNRYVAVVDIGGRSQNADWSVIAVFDRAPQAEGRGPEIAAQWYGHTDMDLLAWKAAQVAAFYSDALLVIESNTLETRDPLRDVEGDQSLFILNQLKWAYPNLYARKQSAEDVRQGLPRKYGFHTNAATKPMVVSALVQAVREGLYTERDERCLNEMLVYECKPNGSYGATIGAHDDLVMTRAIGLHICLGELPSPAPSAALPQPSRGHTAWL